VIEMRQLSLWAVLLAVACSGKMTVSSQPIGMSSAGLPNIAGSGISGARSGHAGYSGIGGTYFGMAGRNAATPDGADGGAPDLTPETETSGGSAGAGGSVGGDSALGIAGRSFAVGGGPADAGIGLPCIAGELVTEADGTPAKAQIQTLLHCAEGLVCNALSKCEPAPDCPQSALCVLRHAAYTSGAGGTPGVQSGFGGGTSAGGAPSYGGDGSPTSLPSTSLSGVTAMTASESTVYWVEYGTRDDNGTYQHDGALLSYAPDSGTSSVIASGLEGPIGVEVTTSHAYVEVDGGRPLGTPIRLQLFRVPLAGGNAELVQDNAYHTSFAAEGGRAFWVQSALGPTTIYSMTSDSDAVATEFITSPGILGCLTIDGTDLYYQTYEQLMRTSTGSAAPVALGQSVGDIVVHDDAVFALQSLSTVGGMLARAPKSGGEFVRVRALGSGLPDGLRRVGDRYFFEASASPNDEPYLNDLRVLTGSFVDQSPLVQLLQRPDRGSYIDHLWVVTGGDLYWSDGRSVFKQPLPGH